MLAPDLLAKLDKGRLPRHIAIVMDGNGRWAQQRLLPRNVGHRAGVVAVDNVVTAARNLGIPCLTLYALSTENWSRPRQEIRALMGILRIYLRKELRRMVRENIRFQTIGRLEDLPAAVQDLLYETIEQTRQNDGMIRIQSSILPRCYGPIFGGMICSGRFFTINSASDVLG
jgi:undecaprenyl diphosphate synthase